MNSSLNYTNVLFMLASTCLAMFIPFELVLLSYAILGPLHYLTEISWLKGRHFFTLKRYDYLFIAAVAIICALLKLPIANLVYYTFGLSFIMLAISSNVYRLLAFALLVAAGYFLLTNNFLRTIFGLYIPTLIHVYVFTGAFLLLGALKAEMFRAISLFLRSWYARCCCACCLQVCIPRQRSGP